MKNLKDTILNNNEQFQKTWCFDCNWEIKAYIMRKCNALHTSATAYHVTNKKFKKILKKLNINQNAATFADIQRIQKEINRRIDNKEKIKKYRRNRVKRILKVCKNDYNLISEYLHTLNKYAKKYRDSQNKMADLIWHDSYPDINITSCHHDILHACKEAKENLYLIKNNLLNILIKQKIASPIGWHKFSGDVYARCYSIGNHTFHTRPVDEYELKDEVQNFQNIIDNAEYLGDIEYQEPKYKDIYFISHFLQILILNIK